MPSAGRCGTATFSGGGGRDLPIISRLRPQEAQRTAGDQVALQVEGVVDGGMGGEEALC